MSNIKRVWLIDDDEDDCFFFETALGELGYPVEFFSERDSEAALLKLHSGYKPIPDLLFLDWNMPKRTGRDCLVAIRQVHAYSYLPVIIYTTSRALPDQREAKRLGASYFLTKPQTIGELAQKLQYLFSLNWITQTNTIHK